MHAHNDEEARLGLQRENWTKKHHRVEKHHNHVFILSNSPWHFTLSPKTESRQSFSFPPQMSFVQPSAPGLESSITQSMWKACGVRVGYAINNDGE
jgi:hypothetical protein